MIGALSKISTFQQKGPVLNVIICVMLFFADRVVQLSILIRMASILPQKKTTENSYNLRNSKVYNGPSKTDSFRNSFIIIIIIIIIIVIIIIRS